MNKNKLNEQVHTFGPIFDSNSEILILGTFPSVKSRENNFYYGHPRNRFWQVIAMVYAEDIPITVKEKKELLLKNKIALWDVIEKCDIAGSSDSSIRNVVPADIGCMIKRSNIRRVFTNGATAKKLYDRYILKATGLEAVMLPSTSPANAAYSAERLIEIWRSIRG